MLTQTNTIGGITFVSSLMHIHSMVTGVLKKLTRKMVLNRRGLALHEETINRLPDWVETYTE